MYASAALVFGCAVPERVAPSTQPAVAAARPIEIRLPTQPAAADAPLRSPRSLACIVTGMGRLPATGPPAERRRAARQAAIVDALHRAAVAMGAIDAGDSARTVSLSDRLTLHRDPVHREVMLRYHDRGRIYHLRVVDHRLAQPPVRDAIIEIFLAEVAQDLRLVGTSHDTEAQTWFARIACYEPTVAASPSPPF